jgi:hypothetical protein
VVEYDDDDEYADDDYEYDDGVTDDDAGDDDDGHDGDDKLCNAILTSRLFSGLQILIPLGAIPKPRLSRTFISRFAKP